MHSQIMLRCIFLFVLFFFFLGGGGALNCIFFNPSKTQIQMKQNSWSGKINISIGKKIVCFQNESNQVVITSCDFSLKSCKLYIPTAGYCAKLSEPQKEGFMRPHKGPGLGLIPITLRTDSFDVQ